MRAEFLKGALLSTLVIVSVIAPVVLLTIVSQTSYAQSSPRISSDQIKIAADKLIPKISNSFKGKGNSALAEAWEGASTGEPILVYTPEEEPCYYIVPVMKNNEVVGEISFSAKTGEWMWYTENYSFSEFPPVSAGEAERAALAYIQESGIKGSLGAPIVKEMPDKCLYWAFPLLVDGKAVTKVYVNFSSVEQVLTEENMRLKAPLQGDVDGCGEITKMATNTFQVPAQTASHYIAGVPYHPQVKSGYCAPAALEMVFDYYGPDISLYEIVDAARTDSGGTSGLELRRAAQFSNLSTSAGNAEPAYTCTGYTGRDLGYAAFEYCPGYYWLNDLKALIDNDYPIIVFTYYSIVNTAGHARVVIGYNDSIGEVIVHDSRQGPNIHFSYTTFEYLWSMCWWGLFTHPWSVSVEAPANVSIGSTFTVTGTVTYPCPPPYNTYEYPAENCQATITLPSSLSLAPGETATKTLGTGDMPAGTSTDVSWQVTAVNVGSCKFTVSAEGMVSGSVPPDSGYPAYSYTDRIGGDQISTIRVISNPHDPIYIEGDDNFIPANGAMSGSGTEDDPYIIENWSMRAENTNGIEVSNTTAHFVIRNCYVYDGGSDYSGIYFYNVTKGLVDNTLLENNSSGFLLIDSDNNIIRNCTARNNGQNGIYLDGGSSCNTIENCIVDSNWVGIVLYQSQNNVITNCIISNNSYQGIWLQYSANNVLRNNILSNNKYAFGVWSGENISEFYQDIDNSNTIDGKPIYYLVERENLIFDGNLMDIGYLGLISSKNILVKNLDMSNVFHGILLANTSYSKLENSRFSNVYYGINLNASSNNVFANCTVSYSVTGVALYGSSDNNIAESCTIENNSWIGISIWHFSSNNILRNSVIKNNIDGINIYDFAERNLILNNIVESNNSNGIYLDSSSNNTISNNIAGNNNYGIYLDSSSNNNIIENNQVNNNNSNGIHLSDSDNNTISGNTFSNNSTNGVRLSNSDNNLVLNNTCENCWAGIRLDISFNNRICHNNFANNAWEQALDYGVNYWDNGYPSGGNYWSNYTDGDYCRGESQDIPVGDGIGDTPYSITGDNNRDRYPLMSPWPLWTGTVTIKRENLYAVTIDLNGDFSAGETLAARFFTYGGTEYQDQTIVCNENIPGHVTLLENVSSPGKDAIQRLELVVVDSGGNVLRTVEIFETSKTIMVARIGKISALWPFANDAQKTPFVTELGSISALWPFAPTTFDNP